MKVNKINKTIESKQLAQYTAVKAGDLILVKGSLHDERTGVFIIYNDELYELSNIEAKRKDIADKADHKHIIWKLISDGKGNAGDLRQARFGKNLDSKFVAGHIFNKIAVIDEMTIGADYNIGSIVELLIKKNYDIVYTQLKEGKLKRQAGENLLRCEY